MIDHMPKLGDQFIYCIGSLETNIVGEVTEVWANSPAAFNITWGTNPETGKPVYTQHGIDIDTETGLAKNTYRNEQFRHRKVQAG